MPNSTPIVRRTVVWTILLHPGNRIASFEAISFLGPVFSTIDRWDCRIELVSVLALRWRSQSERMDGAHTHTYIHPSQLIILSDGTWHPSGQVPNPTINGQWIVNCSPPIGWKKKQQRELHLVASEAYSLCELHKERMVRHWVGWARNWMRYGHYCLSQSEIWHVKTETFTVSNKKEHLVECWLWFVHVLDSEDFKTFNVNAGDTLFHSSNIKQSCMNNSSAKDSCASSI